MLPSNFAESLKEMSDEDVMEILDVVSEELKRRNSLIGPSIGDIHNQSVEENVKMVLESLANLGVHVKPGSGPDSELSADFINISIICVVEFF